MDIKETKFVSKVNNFDYNLEGLRGIAALLVVIHHICVFNYILSPNYQIKNLSNYSPPGHFCVLIFFTLSGYVIGLTNNHKNFNSDYLFSYLKKRFFRLYPIYFIVICFTVWVENEFSLIKVFYHLVFLQVIMCDVFRTNTPLWSLHYEIIYYILFLLIPTFYLNVKYLLVLLFIGAVVGGVIIPFHYEAYLIGAMFWITGLFISWYLPKSQSTYDSNVVISLALGIIVIGTINPLYSIMNKLHLETFKTSNYYLDMINFYDLSGLLVCFVLIASIANRNFKFKKLAIIFYLFSPIPLILYYLITLKGNLGFIILPGIFSILSLLFYFKVLKASKGLKVFSSLGTISYGLYVIHLPVLYIFENFQFFPNSFLGWILKIITYLFICIILAYILERRFQPYVKALLFNKNIK